MLTGPPLPVILLLLLVVGLLAAWRFFLEVRRSEATLRESEHRFSSLADSAPVLIWISDSGGGMAYCNRQWLAFRGRSFEHERGEGWQEAVHPDERASVADSLQQVVEGRLPFVHEFRLRDATGEYRWIIATGTPRLGEDGRFLGFTVSCIDITARKEAEQRILTAHAELDQIFNTAADAMRVVNLRQNLVRANRTFLDLFGLDPDDILTVKCHEAFDCPRRGTERCSHARIVREGEAFEEEVIITRKKDEVRLCCIQTVTPLRGPRGDVIGYIEAFRDITKRKESEAEKERLQAQLYQAQKMESVGVLAGGIAHDFNNILTAVIGYAAIARGKTKEDVTCRYLDDILASSERAAKLVRSLLTFSRKQEMRCTNVHVDTVVRSVHSFLQRIIGEDIELTCTLQAGNATVFADMGQIEQVIMNLAANARDAMPAGGTLLVSTSVISSRAPSDDDAGNGAATHALITVSDTGEGMDADTCRKIFDPFFTTKDTGKGTGLGLAIAHGIVQQHKGRIEVHSEPGKGTCFQIFLPLSCPPGARVASCDMQESVRN